MEQAALNYDDSMLDNNEVEHGVLDQYLTFFLCDEEYGVNILNVMEIKGWTAPTPLPSSPEYINGVTNLRGTIVPIVDLRQLFGMETQEPTSLTVTIILQVESEDGTRIVGFVADSVSEVYDIQRTELKSAPKMKNKISKEFIEGLVTANEKMIITLSIERVLAVINKDDI